MPLQRLDTRSWWTRERVIAGLRRFYQDHDLAPTSTEERYRITGRHGQNGGGRGGRRPYPSFYAVLRHFETFRQAWAAAGVDVSRRQESWSELEDWYLREALGLIPRTGIASDLNRTPDAVHRRVYDLGLHAYRRWGWTLHRVERVAQVPRHRLQKYLDRGDLPYLRGSKCVYVDPADLLVVAEIDWENPPAELAEAALQTWRERLIKVLAGHDWRVSQSFRAQPVVRSDRRWGPRLLRPGPKPVEIAAGDVVQVVGPVQQRPQCEGREGRVHLVFWFVNRSTRNSARSSPQAQWMARVEFTSRHGRSRGPRVTYTLPLDCLRLSTESAGGKIHAHS
ncbi:MAG: hypothetical protein JOZ87_05945 [Chloroflexi bacterium]|nr:hypothetical protein [Chloroflexota bacterium]